MIDRTMAPGPNWPRIIQRVTLYMVLTALGILFLVPAYGVLVTAFKTVGDVSESGYWNLPPRGKRTYHPGHWQRVSGGYRWSPGYWR